MADQYSLPESRYLRTPQRYIWWLMINQRLRVAAAALLGSAAMVGLAAPPYLLSRAIDAGLKHEDAAALVGWASLLFGISVLNAATAGLRHRTMTKTRMDASFRTSWSVIKHSTELGATLPRRVTAGEVVAVGMGDVQAVAQVLTVAGPGVGAVVTYAVVAILLFAISPLLAIVVLAGVPLVAVTIGPLLRRIQSVGGAYRERQGALTGRLVDVVTGLRVLNGLGGKESRADRYRWDSQALCADGYRLGAVTSWTDALGAGIPALFLAAVTWLAARMAAEGTITVGQLVAVYGYVAVLVVPVTEAVDLGACYARAMVAARRVIGFLSIEPEQMDLADAAAGPQPGATLRDPASGVEIVAGRFTAIVGARSADGAAIGDRLARFTPSDAVWGEVALDVVALGEVRERILLADNDADLFAGTVRDVVAGRARNDGADVDDAAIRAAIQAAAASDIVEALSDGLGSHIAPQGRNLSGGQRQRLRLARAVFARPEVLIAVEPTSAVDAHTEAAMASGLRAARDGSTTVVMTTSPLVLDQADVVFYVADGVVVASGTHRDLLRGEPDYRALVARGADEEVAR